MVSHKKIDETTHDLLKSALSSFNNDESLKQYIINSSSSKNLLYNKYAIFNEIFIVDITHEEIIKHSAKQRKKFKMKILDGIFANYTLILGTNKDKSPAIYIKRPGWLARRRK